MCSDKLKKFYDNEIQKENITKFIGTGFTDCLVEYQRKESLKGNLVLIVCSNNYIKEQLKDQYKNIQVETIHSIVHKGFTDIPHEVIVEEYHSHQTSSLKNFIKKHHNIKFKWIQTKPLDRSHFEDWR